MSWMDSASGSSTFHGGGGYSGNSGPSGAGTGGMGGGGSNNSGSRTGGLGGGISTGNVNQGTTYSQPRQVAQQQKVTAASQARMKHDIPQDDPIAAARSSKYGTSTPVAQNRPAIAGMKGGYGVQAYNGGSTAPTKSISDRVPSDSSFTGNNFNPDTGHTSVSTKFQDRVTPGAR